MEIKKLTPILDHVLVIDMNFGERKLSSGIVLRSDDAKGLGIRPRWGKVYAVGPNQSDVVPGQWILVEHGRWTRGSKLTVNGEEITVRRVDKDAIMLVSDDKPNSDEIMGTALDS